MSKKLTTDIFIDRSNKSHGNVFNYSKVEYVNISTKVCIICPEHGEFWQDPNSHMRGTGCSKCGDLRVKRSKQYTTDTFIKKSRNIHGDLYDYSKTNYINSTTTVCIICPEHGEFWQEAVSHIRGHGCIKCGYESESHKLGLDLFITVSNNQHNNKFDYSLVEFNVVHDTITIICPDHGEFKQRVYCHMYGDGCPYCSNSISDGEVKLVNYLTDSGVNVLCNNRSIISPLELDVVIPSKNIAIEYDGNYWHSELNGKTRNYHLNKTKLCQDKNIQLIHIFEDEWINKQSIVKNRLRHILGKTKHKIQARKCEIREITSKKTSQFLNKYHIQGQDKSSIRLGLFYRNRMVAVMTFSKRRFDKKDGYELVRYCTVGHFTVMGGAGKLLKYFERNWKPESIISYADKRWSNGNLYKSLGFNNTHDSTPNYHYMCNHIIRESRQKYQKHKLHKILDNFDPNLSEWENMKNNGYDRIWDCGNMVFEKHQSIDD